MKCFSWSSEVSEADRLFSGRLPPSKWRQPAQAFCQPFLSGDLSDVCTVTVKQYDRIYVPLGNMLCMFRAFSWWIFICILFLEYNVRVVVGNSGPCYCVPWRQTNAVSSLCSLPFLCLLPLLLFLISQSLICAQGGKTDFLQALWKTRRASKSRFLSSWKYVVCALLSTNGVLWPFFMLNFACFCLITTTLKM